MEENINDPQPTVSPRFREAYERIAPELDAMAPSDLLAVNLDIAKAVTTVLGSNPEIVALRDDMARHLPGFDVGVVDKLETYARGAGYAHALYLASASPKRSLSELASVVTQERTQLMSDARALATRELLDADRLREFKGESGHRNLAFEVMGLVALLREHWATIEGKTAAQLSDLERAAGAADELLVAVGLRDQGPEKVNAASERRQRAFTLLVKSYDQVRRAVGYLRWQEGDAESIAPSLYAGRGARGGQLAAQAASAPVSSLPGPAVTPAPVPVGFPGSSPFST